MLTLLRDRLKPVLMLLFFAAPGVAQAQRTRESQQPRVNVPTPPTVTAQSSAPDAYADAREMLNRVFIAMNLRNADSSPFRMVAHVRYQEGGKTLDGTYKLEWAGPEIFRVTFDAGGAQEIDVAAGDKLYVFRTNLAVTLPQRDLRELLISPVPGNLMVDYDVTNVTTEPPGGEALSCIHTVKRDEPTQQQATVQACFDPATKETAKQIESIVAEGNLRNTPMKVELDAFKTVVVKRYPTHMTSSRQRANMPPTKIEVNVETLEDVKKFDGDPFTPPPGAVARDWCLTLAAAPALEDTGQPMFTQAEMAGLSEFFVQVGADGRVETAAPIRPMDPVAEKKIELWLKTARFPIQNCGTNPVEYETFYTPQLKRTY
jgi:hypothetical protein